MHTLTLDVCFGQDQELDDAIDALVNETDVVTATTGIHVAGGWPEVKFAGTWDELVIVANRYGNDMGDTNEVISRIV